ncbi:MAG: hypothetical protein J4F98_11900 [Acidobacteria bacterium]|nr:hypothetical protein [Acidobacteriota bacterium]
MNMGIGWFPRGSYDQYASFRVHDDGFTAFLRGEPGPQSCGRMAAGDMDQLRALWEHPTVVSTGQEKPCSGGFAFWRESPGLPGQSSFAPVGLAPACAETLGKFLRNDGGPRGAADRVPLFRLEWYELPGFTERRFFYWDLESPLPPVIEDAVAKTVKIVCAESKSFQRRFQRHLPELAESFGC